MSTSQRVVIVGPNLPGSLQRLGTFHVHAEGCADLKRGAIRPYAEQDAPYATEYSSRIELADDIYADIMAEGDYASGDLVGDFHFAPCVTLPMSADAPTALDATPAIREDAPMLSEKTARKITKAKTLLVGAQNATTDLPDWLNDTDPAAWDLDVLAAHAKALEAAGCHLRRLVADAEIVKAAS